LNRSRACAQRRKASKEKQERTNQSFHDYSLKKVVEPAASLATGKGWK
jgi:hypothetical protein